MSNPANPQPPELPADADLVAWMHLALLEARAAAEEEEVPVGAIVVHRGTGEVVGRGRDRRVALHDPTAHAEVLALREAAAHHGDWRLEDYVLVVTLEPCLMCAGAALLARIPLVIYGAANPKFGAIAGQMATLDHSGWNHKVHVHGGVLADECAALLTQFFRRRRTP